MHRTKTNCESPNLRIGAILFVLSTIIPGCATQNTANNDSLDKQPPEWDVMLAKGSQILISRSAKDAIQHYFDKVISQCDKFYGNSPKQVYATRDVTEVTYHNLKAKLDSQAIMTVSQTCANALYLRGYASLDLGQIDIAEEYVKRALEMSPVNSRYLSELGHIYHAKHKWEMALTTFESAEDNATAFSPRDSMKQELARAKRGIGYSLIELGRLAEAEEKLRECLEIDPDDQDALDELKYIASIRERQSTETTCADGEL